MNFIVHHNGKDLMCRISKAVIDRVTEAVDDTDIARLVKLLNDRKLLVGRGILHAKSAGGSWASYLVSDGANNYERVSA